MHLSNSLHSYKVHRRGIYQYKVNAYCKQVMTLILMDCKKCELNVIVSNSYGDASLINNFFLIKNIFTKAFPLVFLYDEGHDLVIVSLFYALLCSICHHLSYFEI